MLHMNKLYHKCYYLVIHKNPNGIYYPNKEFYPAQGVQAQKSRVQQINHKTIANNKGTNKGNKLSAKIQIHNIIKPSLMKGKS